MGQADGELHREPLAPALALAGLSRRAALPAFGSRMRTILILPLPAPVPHGVHGKGTVATTDIALLQQQPAPLQHHHTIEGLYAEHRGWLQSWLRRKLGCADHAADLVQETFIRVLTAGGASAVGQIREPRPFLATVAKRLAMHHHRRQLLETSYLEALAALPQEMAPSPEEQLLAVQALQQIDAVLDGLPARVKEAFLLAHLEELGYAEIAERLGVSTSSVKQYLTRANRQCLFAIAV